MTGIASRCKEEMVGKKLQVSNFNVLVKSMQLDSGTVIDVRVLLLRHGKILIVVKPDPPNQGSGSIKLKLKMPPSRLRESTTSNNISTRESLEPAEMVSGPRSSRAKRQVVESDSDDDDDEEDEEEDEDAEGEEEDDEDAEGEEDEDEDAEGESDVEMEDAPTPPVIRKTGSAAKPTITITTAPKAGKVKSVEAKEELPKRNPHI